MKIAKLTEEAMKIRRRFAKLEKAKLGREWTKEEVMQGFVVDIGDLMRLVMATSGIRDVEGFKKKLAHELADCLWSVLVLAVLYDVDIELEFLKTMKELDASITARMKRKR